MFFVNRIGLFLISAFLNLISFCYGDETSSETINDTEPSNSMNLVFPTLKVGKDETSLYFVNISFGNPAQGQALRVDIAQPYLWLLTYGPQSACDPSILGCNSSTTYNVNSSATSFIMNEGHVYEFNFVDTVSINGTAVTDKMNITGLNMDNNIVNKSSNNESSFDYEFTSDFFSISNISFFDSISTLNKGSLGLSAKISNSPSDINSENFDSSFYLLDVLTDLGIIESSSYSLWLGADTIPYYMTKSSSGTSSNSGNLILGAVDPNLFEGDLVKFGMMPSYDLDTETVTTSYPILPMGPIYIAATSGKSLNLTAEEFMQPVLLDSRYTVNYLPVDTIVQVALQIGAIYVESIAKWLVPCSVADLGVYLNFTFAELTISVPLYDFLSSTYDSTSNTTFHFSNGETACFLAMLSRDRLGFNVLGGAFLKNIYMAVDLEDKSFAIAQASQVHTSISGSMTSLSAANYTSAVRPIFSGRIPYAVDAEDVPANITFSPTRIPSVNSLIPDQLTATVYSNGLVSTGRSFYETSRVNTSPTSSAASIESFVFTNSSGTATKNWAMRRSPLEAKDFKSSGLWSIALLSVIAISSIALFL